MNVELVFDLSKAEQLKLLERELTIEEKKLLDFYREQKDLTKDLDECLKVMMANSKAIRKKLKELLDTNDVYIKINKDIKKIQRKIDYLDKSITYLEKSFSHYRAYVHL